MRNLKKILALVLALVMSMSVMSISNAAFTDAKDVTGTYNEAVEVLAGMGVFQGRPDGSFDPQGKITRAEVAAIIYRIVTGDTSDKQVGIYADYNKFDDVKSTAWYAGYVNYCANAEYIKGYDAKTFGPNDSVTGYQALAMILRAVGYDKMGEFTGSGWQVQTAAYGQQLGITTNITAGTLGVAATREVVAEILFNTVAYVPTVTYTMLTGYNQYTTINGTVLNNTLGEMAPFYLDSRADTDAWARPATRWFNSTKASSHYYAIIPEAALAEFNTAVTECDVAHEAGISTSATLPLYVNGQRLTQAYTINAVDTVTKMGAQGRMLEVYADRIVMVDTFLAFVVDVEDAVYDAKGHMVTPATIYLNVYDDNTDAIGSNTVDLVMTNGKINYTGYAYGDFVLVNAYTGTTTLSHVASDDIIPYGTTGSYGELYGHAETLTPGTQTLIWTTVDKHTVNGTDYNDAAEFHLDQAGRETTAHTWYFDQFGNLIGAADIATDYSYGVIKALWWAGDVTNGAGVAKASVVYMDGSEDIVTLGSVRIDDEAVDYAHRYVPAYSTETANVMDVALGNNAIYASGKLYVATNAATNALYDNGTNGHGIILDNLFRFNVDANGYVHAVEVDNDGVNVAVAAYALKNDTTEVRNGIPTNPAVKVNASTIFMIKNPVTNAITHVTGFNNVGTYVTGEVDYVVGSLGFAKYVYITAPSSTAMSVCIFVPTTQQYSYDPATGIYTMFGYVDGKLGELKTTDNPGVAFGNARALTNMASSNIKVNTPYVIKTVNGMADLQTATNDAGTTSKNNVYEVKADSRVINEILDGANTQTGYYTNNAYAGQSITFVSGGYVLGGVYQTSDGRTFNIENVTPVVGEWTTYMTNKNVALISYTAYNGQIVLSAYVFDRAPGAVANRNEIIGWSVPTITGVTNGEYVEDARVVATATYRDTTAEGDTANLRFTTVWQKWNAVTNVWETLRDGDVFVNGGVYQYITSVSIRSTNTNGNTAEGVVFNTTNVLMGTIVC